jgi:hypothetical protein
MGPKPEKDSCDQTSRLTCIVESPGSRLWLARRAFRGHKVFSGSERQASKQGQNQMVRGQTMKHWAGQKDEKP